MDKKCFEFSYEKLLAAQEACSKNPKEIVVKKDERIEGLRVIAQKACESFGPCDKSGKPLCHPIKVGDRVHVRIHGKLVSAEVTSLNPLALSSNPLLNKKDFSAVEKLAEANQAVLSLLR